MALTSLAATPVFQSGDCVVTNDPTQFEYHLLCTTVAPDPVFQFPATITLGVDDVIDLSNVTQKAQLNTYLSSYGYTLP